MLLRAIGNAKSSWTKGGGASVGKPKPGTMTWIHAFDTSSTVLMGYICNGKSFPKVELRVRRATGSARPESSYFTMAMESAYITRVATSGTSEGDITQSVEMVFNRQDQLQAAGQHDRPARSSQGFQLGHPGGHGIAISLSIPSA